MKTIACLLLLAGLCLGEVYFADTFDDSWEERWVESNFKKSTGEKGFFLLGTGEFYADAEASKGIMTTEDMRFYTLSAKMDKPFSNEGKTLVFQYVSRFTQKIDCGGAYLKLMPHDLEQETFNNNSPYYIMFGPDVCGGTKKVHLIFNYKGKNLDWKKKPTPPTDQLSHLYRVVINPDNTYEYFLDEKSVEKGNLKDDWDFLPPKKIKDPAVSKPKDWVDEKEIDDPEDKKPEDWDDQPEMIDDPEAKKPDDWDDEEDGEWQAPTIPNPDYKGEWKPKKIPNPDYKGPWVHPEIDNPDYYEDDTLYRYENIGALGIEIWQVKSGTHYDNIFVGDSVEEADEHANTHWKAYAEAEKEQKEEIEKKKEEERKAAEEAARLAAEEEEQQEREEEAAHQAEDEKLDLEDEEEGEKRKTDL